MVQVVLAAQAVEAQVLEGAAGAGQAPVVQVVLAAQAVEAQVLEGAVGAGQAPVVQVILAAQAVEAQAVLAAREAGVRAPEEGEEPGLVEGQALALARVPGAGREEVEATLPQVKAEAAQGPDLAADPEARVGALEARVPVQAPVPAGAAGLREQEEVPEANLESG